MFSPLRRCSIASFPKPRQLLTGFLIYLCDYFLCVTTDSDLEISVDHPLHTSRPMGSLGFQHTETVCKRLQIERPPCRLIFPPPPPSPLSPIFPLSPILVQRLQIMRLFHIVKLRFNELLGITNNIFRPGKSYSKMYGITRI